MVELLSPSGNFSSLNAALKNGADSVYIGLNKWSMRANSKNFTLDELKEAIKLAHNYSASIYLTTNTILKDNDILKLESIIPDLANIELDALIISDLGLINSANDNNLDIHLSIQENISNICSLKILKELGVKRAVLSRELNINDIKKICTKSPIETEIFIHGAMCMAVSGRCFLSSYFYGKSANCGECLQPCRFEWSLNLEDNFNSKSDYFNKKHDYLNEENNYLGEENDKFNENKIKNKIILSGSEDNTYSSHFFSPNDLAMIEHIPELMETGVDAFKIEGRARSPDYVATVTEVYREAIDLYLSNPKNYKVNPIWISKLKKVFNRGFDTGFYFKKPYKQSQQNQSKFIKKDIGKVENYYNNIHVGEFKLWDKLEIGDEILIQGKTTGSINHVIKSMEINHKSVNIAKKGENVAIAIDKKIRKNDNLYKLIKRE